MSWLSASLDEGIFCGFTDCFAGEMILICGGGIIFGWNKIELPKSIKDGWCTGSTISCGEFDLWLNFEFDYLLY